MTLHKLGEQIVIQRALLEIALLECVQLRRGAGGAC